MSPNRHEAGDEETPFYSPVRAEPIARLAALIGNTPGRQTTALHGSWQFIVDQADLGDASPMMHGGIGRDEAHDPDELLEYSFDGADTLQVPGDWNTQRPELFWYRGVIWYRKRFRYSAPAGRRIYLYFGAANFRKDIYLNGQFLARHVGGFTPFNIDVSDYLRDGENSLVVKVDSRSGPDEIPTEYNDWLNYGGLTREVLLVELPSTFIRNYKIQLRVGSLDVVSGWVVLEGPTAARASVVIEIPRAGIRQRLTTDASGRAEFEFPARLNLWSPQSPTRYIVAIEASEERLHDDIGFRSLAVQGEHILLNGKPVFLRGISMHEEALQRPGRAWDAEDAAVVIAEVQALHANFLRLAHYPHNENIVRAADAAGILLWAELPVYQRVAFANPDTLASAKRQYDELIARDQNRAAVVMWSLANETAETPARTLFLTTLATHVRAADDTRLITAALLGNAQARELAEHVGRVLIGRRNGEAVSEPSPMRIDDPLMPQLDVVACNEYLGWYSCAPLARELRRRGIEVREREIRELMLELMPGFTIESVGKPLLVSEFGAEALQGFHASGLELFSEEYQARVYQAQLAMLAGCQALCGLSPWILKDFRAPYRLHTRFQQYWNRKGVISERGLRKQAFAVLAAHYRERARHDG